MAQPFVRSLALVATVLAPSAAFAQSTAPASPPATSVAPVAPETPTNNAGAASTASTPTPAPSVPAQTATNTPAQIRLPDQNAVAPVPPVATPAPVTQGNAPARSWLDGFSFGSYGRVVAASDLRGRLGRQANIVAHGTRIDEDIYAELELHRDDDWGPVHTRMVATLAIMGPLFHQSGTFSAQLAIRNLYVEERGAILPGLAVWVGSRMYRGDDIYLLDWWPLDNLNTVGGGARYDIGNAVTIAAHVGLNRLDTAYQYQQISVVPRDGIGAASVAILDRPRTIGSLKATWWLNGRSARTGFKLSLYGEIHELPAGVRLNTDSNQYEQLPADSGFVVGAQVGAYTVQRNTFVNLFFRYGQGLGAYGDLAVPYTLTASQTSERARDVVLAATGNFERGPFGLLGAAYVRYFRDADPALFGRNEMWEGTVVLRPTIWIGDHVGVAAEGSYQAVQFNMVDPVTGVGPRSGSLWRFGLIPFITPAGRGNFTRPHLRVIYAITLRDAGAQRLYPPDDPFAHNAVEHFLGVGCEWWFNSSYL